MVLGAGFAYWAYLPKRVALDFAERMTPVPTRWLAPRLGGEGRITMLKPLDTPTRERKDLSGLWRFKADPDEVGEEQRWFGRPLDDAFLMPVPASYNDIVPGRALHE